MGWSDARHRRHQLSGLRGARVRAHPRSADFAARSGRSVRRLIQHRVGRAPSPAAFDLMFGRTSPVGSRVCTVLGSKSCVGRGVSAPHWQPRRMSQHRRNLLHPLNRHHNTSHAIQRENCGSADCCADLHSARFRCSFAEAQDADSSDAPVPVHRENASRRPAPVILSPDDGLSVIAAALDAASRRPGSVTVHTWCTPSIFRPGFPILTRSSSDLYDGTDEFQRVTRPQPGDLVVWPGHVGIVVNPAQRVFFSRLRRGPGIDAYDAQYWKQRGQARFYRYVKQVPAPWRRRVWSSQRHK